MAAAYGLPESHVGESARQGVRSDHHDQGENGLEQTDGRRVFELAVFDTGLKNVGIQNLGNFTVRRLLQQEDLVVSGVQQIAHAHDEHDADGHANAGERHVPDLLEVARAVDGRGLVQLRVHRGDGREVDDGSPADVLPHVGEDDQREERGLQSHDEDGIVAERLADVVHHAAVGREERAHQGDNDDPGDEVRQVADRLDHALVLRQVQLVEQQGQNNRRREAERQLQKADTQRVLDRDPELRRIDELVEVLHAGPRASEDAQIELIVLEGQHNAAHGRIAENNQPDKARQNEQIQHPVAFDLHPQLFALVRLRIHGSHFRLHPVFLLLVISGLRIVIS